MNGRDGGSGDGGGELRRLASELLGAEVAAVAQLGVDAYNAHYRVDLADGGRVHMVRYFNTGDRALEGISFEHEVLLHLERRGFTRLPRLVAREEGGQQRTLFRQGDDWFALSEWIEGCAVEADRPVTVSQIRGVAACAADLHRAMEEGFARRLRYLPEHIFVYPAFEVRQRGEALVARLRAVAEGAPDDAFDAAGRAALRRWLPAGPAWLERFPWALYDEVRGAAAARGEPLVHGDLRLLNLVFRGDEVATVLDFNASFNEIRLWDLCYTALSLAGVETLGEPRAPERAALFLGAYHERHPLSRAERALLPEFLIYTVTKLMLAAPCSWWVVQRAPLLDALQAGLAARLCAALD
jgi:Ser/Thr protein kinase RdoA (MazF antagonist)